MNYKSGIFVGLKKNYPIFHLFQKNVVISQHNLKLYSLTIFVI
jgi:hypothetical protein